MTHYENATLVILEGNCGEYGAEFAAWVEKNHPEIEIDFHEKTAGIGGNLFDSDWNEVENTLWDDFCNQ